MAMNHPTNAAGSSEQNESSKQDSEEMQVEERPLEYLLSGDIESSDPGDDDYNIEDEDISSCESEESSESEGADISTKEFFGQEPGFLSGSTATVAIIHQNRIYVANVGDSRCVLSRNGRAIDLSLDHKPDDPEEKARIIGAGGSISEDGRVNGCLNLSRAFGDFKFKGRSLEPSQQCITAEPFVNSINIEKDDNFLIIASDGIWNSMSSQEVVDFVEIRLRDGHSSLEDICEEMFLLTLAADTDNDGSGCDNMCCIIIKLNETGDSSFIYKTCESTRVRSSDKSLKQEGKNINAPTSDSADQMASIPEKTSLVDEKSIHQSSHNLHLTAQSIKQYMENLKSSHWVDCDIKKIRSNFLQNDMQCSVCSLRQKETLKSPKTVVPPIFGDKLTYEKGKGLKKPLQLDNLRNTDSTNSYMEQIVHNLKNTQLEEVFLGVQINDVVNLAGSYLQNMMIGTY